MNQNQLNNNTNNTNDNKQLMISNNYETSKKQDKNNPIVPQSTKNSGHSKIKGFSFQLENNNNNKISGPKEEITKEKFQILEDEFNSSKNGRYHKNKISMNNAPSNLLGTNNKENSKLSNLNNNNQTNNYNLPTNDNNNNQQNIINNNNNNQQNNLNNNKTNQNTEYKQNTNSNSNTNNKTNNTSDTKKDSQYNSNNVQNNNNLNGNPKTISETPLNITDLIKDQNFVPLSKDALKKEFEKYESARHSAKSLSVVKSFAANTHQGTVRKYNEDRVSIILNIVKPNTYKGNYWPSCSFFAVFDGHGGSKCADYLKDNLHNFVSFV